MSKRFSPKIRRSTDLARKTARKASYDRLLIVCEGSKTEPNYFKEIRQIHRLNTANVAIYPSKSGTAPIQVVEYAKKLFENGNTHLEIKARAFERVYVVFKDDHESYSKALARINTLNKKIKNDNGKQILFRAIVSIPNFELWILLHFENIQRPISGDKVLKQLKKHMDYDKAIPNLFSKTKDKLLTAYERAQALSKKNCALDGSFPYTDIGELVMGLIKLKG